MQKCRNVYRERGWLRRSGTLRGLKRAEVQGAQHKGKAEVAKAERRMYGDLYAGLDSDLYRLMRQRDRDGKDMQQARVIEG